MSGQQIGYIRVSSTGQKEGRQLEGVTLDKAFTDKVSGSTKDRPALQQCIEYAREGDTLHCHSIDRLGRNLRDLEDIIAGLNSKAVTVQFHKEGLTFKGKDDAMGKLLFQIMGAFAQFERSLIRERQAEGIARAKRLGKRFGPPNKLTVEQVQEVRRLVAERYSKADIARQYGVSRQTIYNVITAR